MTILEMEDKIFDACNRRWRKQGSCEGCPLRSFPLEEKCVGKDADIKRNYDLMFGNEDKNPYWERICKLSDRQRAKGMKTYGQGLEKNPADILKRIEHLEEELIDSLYYIEWIKDNLETIMGKDGKNE